MSSSGPKLIGQDKKINFMLYGRPGIGKTRLVGGWPDTLILRPPVDHTRSIRTKNVYEWVMRDWDTMNEAFEYLRHEASSGKHPWVWLDSISLFQDIGLDDIWDRVVAEKPHHTRYGLDKGEYGINMDRLARWVRDVVELPGFNFGITAHPFDATDPETGEVLAMPWIQGQRMPQKICGYMNVVGYYTFDSKGRRVLKFDANPDYHAKDQTDLLGSEMLDPTMSKIMQNLGLGNTTQRRTPRRATKRS